MPVRIDSIGQILLKKELKEYIKSLEPGDTVKGRVVESENGEVTIKATNGQTIKASLSSDINLQSGQFIEMQVDDIIDDRVFASLRAVEKKSESSDQVLKSIIKGMGLPATPENMAVLKTMIKNNLPLNSDNMNKLAGQYKSSKSLSNTSPQGMIGLLASGSDLRNTNVDVLRKLAASFEIDLEQYLGELETSDTVEEDYDFSDDEDIGAFSGTEEDTESSDGVKKSVLKTGRDGEKTISSEPDMVDNPSIEGKSEKDVVSKETEKIQDAVKSADQEIKKDEVTEDQLAESLQLNGDEGAESEKLLSAKKAAGGKNVSNENLDNISDRLDENMELTEAEETSESTEETQSKNTGILDRKNAPRTMTEIHTAYLNNGAFSRAESETLDFDPDVLGKAEKSLADITNLKERLQPEAIRAQLEQVGIETTPEIDAFIDKAASILKKLDNVSMEKLAWLASKGLEATPANLETLDHHINSTNHLSDLVEKLDKQLSAYSDPGLKSLRETVASIGIKPHELTEGDRVKETLRDLVKVSESIDLTLSRSGINDEGIRNTLSNVKDNIDFMRQINQFNNFLQVPLQMNQQNTTADLYVYKDKSRSKLIDPENATILVALDLPKSGRIESLIKLSGKTVNATFRLERPEVGTAIKRSEKVLADRLEAKGYQMNPIKTIQLDEVFNLMKLEELIGGANIDRLHFDMRI